MSGKLGRGGMSGWGLEVASWGSVCGWLERGLRLIDR